MKNRTRNVTVALAIMVLTTVFAAMAEARTYGGVSAATVWAYVKDRHVKSGTCLLNVGFRQLTQDPSEDEEFNAWVFAERSQDREVFRQCRSVPRPLRSATSPIMRPFVCLDIHVNWRRVDGVPDGRAFRLTRRLKAEDCGTRPWIAEDPE